MRDLIIILFLLINVTFLSESAQALVPVESLVLGNFSENYSESKNDPLNFVFSRELITKKENKVYKEELAKYRAFYEEGKNTQNYCALGNEIKYKKDWDRIQSKRAFMSLVQYVGLDLTVRAIPLYAKKLEFTSEEYTNMVTNLVGNYCSGNLSIISKRELLNNFFLKWEKENNFKLPSVENNPLFPKKLDKHFNQKQALEQELIYTVKIFQSLCSWSGNPNNTGLMTPFLRHSGLVSFFARELAGLNIEWREIDNFLYLKADNNTQKIWCDNLICRKVSNEEFNLKFKFSIGGTNVYDDYKRLYCDDFRNASYRPKENDPRIAKMMNDRTFDEEHLMSSQFVSLITGVPDFILKSNQFIDAKEIIRLGVDYKWDQWADLVSKNFSDDIYFEEPLLIELVDRNQYYDFRQKQLKVAFDINMGEFDRINQINGKLKVTFKIKVLNSFLKYYKSTYNTTSFKEQDKILHLKDRLKLQIKDGVLEARKKFIIPPWKGDLEMLIVNELTTQISESSEKFLNFNEPGSHEIQIEINYGIFALKYLNHQLNIKKNVDGPKS